ncbi:hypothetical protein KPH14_013126 [Odynerus spinipes]|uniref:Uncharacterized protein n=1 Tax=Odynerus spinipes TaxID=1348599 RepID=A0AAD9R8H6_9HYME|nr:hypothetical protein KPH14_013126 [Odynerus spinipes]
MIIIVGKILIVDVTIRNSLAEIAFVVWWWVTVIGLVVVFVTAVWLVVQNLVAIEVVVGRVFASIGLVGVGASDNVDDSFNVRSGSSGGRRLLTIWTMLISGRIIRTMRFAMPMWTRRIRRLTMRLTRK